jgi:hypothetical protein
VYPDNTFKINNRIDEILDWRAAVNDPHGLEARYPFDKTGAMYGPRNRSVDLEFMIEIFQHF